MNPESLNEFIKSLEGEAADELWPEALKALWHDGKGDWEAAHNIAQDITSNLGNWIHAYLHRKEGDKWNAEYWYQQANRPYPVVNLDEEFRQLVNQILKGKTS
jgi:hypothetical protein